MHTQGTAVHCDGHVAMMRQYMESSTNNRPVKAHTRILLLVVGAYTGRRHIGKAASFVREINGREVSN